MRPSLRGVVWSAWGAVAVLIAAAAMFDLYREPGRMAQPPATSEPTAARPAEDRAAPPAAVPTPQAKAPSFDIVTVDRAGQAVIAGRAAPGDRVRVLDGDVTIGEVNADQRGEWVLAPAAPIGPGNRQLGVEATVPGGAVRRSPDIVALSVAGPGAARGERSGGTSAVAVLLPGEPGAPARVLQRPQALAGDRTLSLDTVEYGGPDELVLAGGAEPGARLNVYAGGRLIGSATADDAGKWMLRSDYRGPAGAVELRLEQLAADGSVARRIAAPLTGPAPGDGDTYVVERGNSLWRIARRHYGMGTRYTVIHAANQATIRDPKLIYPGQELRLPRP